MTVQIKSFWLLCLIRTYYLDPYKHDISQSLLNMLLIQCYQIIKVRCALYIPCVHMYYYIYDIYLISIFCQTNHELIKVNESYSYEFQN